MKVDRRISLRSRRSPGGHGRLIAAATAGLAVSVWPWVLHYLELVQRFWDSGDLGPFPLLMLASGFTGTLVFGLVLARRANWGMGVSFSSILGAGYFVLLGVKERGFQGLELLTLAMLLFAALCLVVGGMAGAGLAVLVWRPHRRVEANGG